MDKEPLGITLDTQNNPGNKRANKTITDKIQGHPHVIMVWFTGLPGIKTITIEKVKTPPPSIHMGRYSHR